MALCKTEFHRIQHLIGFPCQVRSGASVFSDIDAGTNPPCWNVEHVNLAVLDNVVPAMKRQAACSTRWRTIGSPSTAQAAGTTARCSVRRSTSGTGLSHRQRGLATKLQPQREVLRLRGTSPYKARMAPQ